MRFLLDPLITMSFEECSRFNIYGGHFTKANHVSHHIVRRNVVNLKLVQNSKRNTRTIWDEVSELSLLPQASADTTSQYNHVRTGDVYIERGIAKTTVRREADDATKEQYELWRYVDARRNLSVAQLRGEHREGEFLYVTYDGPHAFKVITFVYS
jgi:hypothetical protein